MSIDKYLNPYNVEYFLKEPYCKSGNRLAYSTPLATAIFSQLNQLIYYNIADNVFIIDQDEIVASYIVNNSNEAKEEFVLFVKENEGYKFSYVEEKDISFFYRHFITDQSNYEAIYPISRFASFDVLCKERNLAKKFFEKYPNITLLKYDKITLECKESLKIIYDNWMNLKFYEDDLDIYIINLPVDYTLSGLKIYITLIDNIPAAYTIGDINLNNFNWLCEKCNTKYRGIYQGTKQLIAKDLEQLNITHINYTSLTGAESLRQMKLGLKPSELIKPQATYVF